MKSKFKITRADYLKATRKARRDEEIREHLHPVNINRVHKSKKVYNRKRDKADLNKDLPYFRSRLFHFFYSDDMGCMKIYQSIQYLQNRM